MAYWRRHHIRLSFAILYLNSFLSPSVSLCSSLRLTIISITVLFYSCWFLNWSHVTIACCINTTCLLYMILMSFRSRICICAQLIHCTLDSFWEAIYQNDKVELNIKEKKWSVLIYWFVYFSLVFIIPFTIAHEHIQLEYLKCLMMFWSVWNSRVYGLGTLLCTIQYYFFIHRNGPDQNRCFDLFDFYPALYYTSFIAQIHKMVYSIYLVQNYHLIAQIFSLSFYLKFYWFRQSTQNPWAQQPYGSLETLYLYLKLDLFEFSFSWHQFQSFDNRVFKNRMLSPQSIHITECKHKSYWIKKNKKEKKKR